MLLSIRPWALGQEVAHNKNPASTGWDYCVECWLTLLGSRNNDNNTGDINKSTRIPKYFGINQIYFISQGYW